MAENESSSLLSLLQRGSEAGGRVARPPSPFVVRTLAPRVGFAKQGVQPPTTGYLTQNDVLVFHAETSQPSIIFTLEGRFLSPDGRISYFSVPLRPAGDRIAVTQAFTLGEAFLLGASVRSSVALPRGSAWVKLYMTAGTVESPGSLVNTIFQGHIDGFFNPSWPLVMSVPETEGKGNIRLIGGTDPAAGFNFSETVPTNARWRIVSLNITFVTDATVATRVIRIAFDNGVNVFCFVEAPASQTASLTRRYVLAGFGAGQAAVADTIHLPLPTEVILRAGFRVRSSVATLQAGDDIGELFFVVEEWIEP